MHAWNRNHTAGLPIAILLWLGLGAAALGCLSADEICGDNMDIVNSFCAPRVDSETGTSTAADTEDSEEDADGGVDTGPDTGKDSLPLGMGDVCAGNGDCIQEADFCAMPPPATEGTCTVQGCTVSPNDCPPDYHCIDLAAMFGVPTLPTICDIGEE